MGDFKQMRTVEECLDSGLSASELLDMAIHLLVAFQSEFDPYDPAPRMLGMIHAAKIQVAAAKMMIEKETD
jgi:hypothetical protein